MVKTINNIDVMKITCFLDIGMTIKMYHNEKRRRDLCHWLGDAWSVTARTTVTILGKLPLPLGQYAFPMSSQVKHWDIWVDG